ncbi:MAG: hypothetical protein IT233_12450 [Bacteroidia bacterium]|nr:hypothetical protein [Bacteroidia bacterium]
MAFKVIKIVNEYTVMIAPEWRVWKHKMGGKKVRATDYSISSKADVRRDAKKQLLNNVLGKTIEIRNISGISSSGILMAEIWCEGQSVARLMQGLKPGKVAKKAAAPRAVKEEPVAEIAAEGSN